MYLGLIAQVSKTETAVFAEAKNLSFDPHSSVVDRLGRHDQVEGGGQGAALVKVRDPQLGARKLPLNVCVVLWSVYSSG